MRNEDLTNSGADMVSGAQEVSETEGGNVEAAAIVNAPPVIRGDAMMVTPGPDGVVTLPAGVELSDIQVLGRDLVIELPDGSQMVIVDGAIFVPQLVIGTVEVPPTNLAALLIGDEPEPAAGPANSSGGNFASPVGELGPRAELGDLLPPTERFRPLDTEEEIGRAIVEDEDPQIVVETEFNTPGVPDAIADVEEEALPERGDEPAGTNEPSTGEVTSGNFIFDAPAGSVVSIGGVPITSVGQVFQGDFGQLIITSIEPGNIGFDYILSDNVNNGVSEVFPITVTTPNGATADGSLTIAIIDDAPIAVDDGPIAVAEDTAVVIDAFGNDIEGADGVALDDISLTTGASNGDVVYNGDGTFTYTPNPGFEGQDSFTYTIVDGDGSSSTATVTVVVDPDSTPEIAIAEGSDTVVNEAGLDDGGSDAGSDSEIATGALTFDTGNDTVGSLVIGGVDVTNGGTVDGDYGTLTVTGNPTDGYTYSYELTTNLDDVDGAETDDFDVVLTDSDGDEADTTLSIEIVDDVPTANDDSANQAPEDADVTVDVFANDVAGADGVDLVNGVEVVPNSLVGAGTLTYNDDGTFTYDPVPGEEGVVTFDYQITDGDGDTSTATVTITLLPDSTPDVSIAEGSDTVVNEAALDGPPNGEAPGSNAASNDEVATGSIDFDTGNDTVGSLVIGGVDVTNGGTVMGAYGTLTVTGNPTDGYSYSYELTTNTDDLAGVESDDFAVVLTDSDGDVANTDLSIEIIDDVPTANDDTDSDIAEGGPYSTDGNVITGVGTDEGAGGLGTDVEGADGAAVSTTGDFVGTYGTLTLNADGSYTYVLSDEGQATLDALTDGESISESFDYTLTDGDNDSDDATLTFVMNGEDDIVTINGLDGQGAEEIVDEDDLSDGSSPDEPALTQDGSFGFDSPDGVDDVTIGGTLVIIDGVYQGNQTISTQYGELTITGFTPVLDDANNVVGGTFDYEYELTDNTLDHDAAGEDNVFDDIMVVVTDEDGDSDTAELNIEIVDDIADARPDVDSDIVEGGPTSTDGNVISGAGTDDGVDGAGSDIEGADGASVTTVGQFVGTYGTLTLNADGSYNYQLSADGIAALELLTDGETIQDEFDYTLTDGDLDSDDSTLTFIMNGEDDPVVINGLVDGDAPEEIVDEDDLSDGSSPDEPALTQDGSFGFDSPDGVDDFSLGGTLLIENGVYLGDQTINGDYGDLTITGFTPVLSADGTTIIGGTFTYEYVLGDNTEDHGPQGEDFVEDNFAVQVTDQDGDVANDSLDVRVVDDVPTAEDDGSIGTPIVVAEDTAKDIDVFDNDTAGADGVDLVNDVTVVSGPSNGSLVYNDDGTFTYTPDAGYAGADQFEYQIEDADGDVDTAIVYLNVSEDSLPVIDTPTDVAVDEDGFGDANADDGQTDPEELTGNGLLVNTGTVDVDFGADVPANEADALAQFSWVDNAALDNWLDANGTDVTFAVVGDALVGSAGGSEVIRIELDGASINGNVVTYTYEVTLLQELDHQNGDDSEAATTLEGVTFEISDPDSSFTTQSSFDVTVQDDVPETDVAGDTTVVEGEAAAGTWSTVVGADNPGSTVVIFNGAEYAIDADIDTGNGTLTVNGDGTWDFVADDNLDNDIAQGISFTVRTTDGDGDVAEDTQNVSITDGDPPLGGDTLTLTVDDEALSDGNNAISPNEVDDGMLSFTAGSDDLVDFAFGGTGGLDASLDWEVVSDTEIVGWDGGVGTGTKIVTLTLSAGTIAAGDTGDVTVTATLNNNYTDHPLFTQDDTFDLGDITVIAADHDGDSATGTVSLLVSDDVPEVQVGGDVTVVEGETANGTWNVDMGADNPGSTVVVFNGAEYAIDAAIDTGNGTLTVNGDGTWDFVADDNLDNDLAQSISFAVKATDTDNDSVSDGQSVTITDGDPPVGGGTLTLTVDDDALSDGSNSISPDEVDSGNLSFTAGSDDLTDFAFGGTGGLHASLDWEVVSDTEIVGWDGGVGTGTKIVTLTLSAGTIAAGDTDTVSVTATLNNNYADHPLFTQDDTFDLGDITVVASDHDGDSAIGTVSLMVSDDVPTANTDGSATPGAGLAVAEDTPLENINVFANDVQGADGVVFADITLETQASNGTAVYNGDGTFTYTPNAGFGGDDSFTYTIEDADGDKSTATVYLTVAPDSEPVIATPGDLTVDEDGLAGANADEAPLQSDPQEVTSTGSATDSNTVVVNYGNDVPANLTAAFQFINPDSLDGDLFSGGQPVDFELVGGELVGTIDAGATEVVRISLDSAAAGPGAGDVTYTYDVLLSQPIDHADDESENSIDLTGVEFRVTDSDGDTAEGNFDVTIVDDVPSMGEIVDGSSNNDPLQTPFVGALNFTDSADGVGSITIAVDTTGITAGGSNLLTSQTGNVLTAYADNDNSGTINAGDTEVFTITVDPTAGASGEYEFDLLAPLDGDIVDTPIGGATAFGAGPASLQILDDGNASSPLAVVSGYTSFGAVAADVNGSVAGWGIDSNTFNTGDLFVWDFGSAPLEDYDGPGGILYPANPGLPDITFATFDFKGIKNGDVITNTVHYTDGTSEVVIITQADLTGTTFTFNAPAGKFIDYIEMIGTTLPGGGRKVQLTNVGVATEDVDIDLAATITIVDEDGDTVSDDFNIDVVDLNAPFSLASSSREAITGDNDNQLLQQQSFSQSLMMGTAIATGFGMESMSLDSGLDASFIAMPSALNMDVTSMFASQASALTFDAMPAFDMTAMMVDAVPMDMVSTMVDFGQAVDLGSVDVASFAPAVAEQVAFDAGTPMAMPANDGFAAMGGGDIAMPGADAMAMLAAAGRVPAEGLEGILADALAGGEASPLDAALASLGGEAGLAMGMVEFGDVAMWDNGVLGGFTPAAPEAMVMDAMVLHHDAVTPAVNG